MASVEQTDNLLEATNSDNKDHQCNVDKSTETVNLLANGLLNLYEPHFSKLKKELNELIEKQNKIQADLTVERENYTQVWEAEFMINDLKKYKEKLLIIKKQMLLIHHKTGSLKKRANHIKEFKEKELEVKIQKRQHEENLIAKGPSSSASSPTS